MTKAAQKLIESFEVLTEEDRHEVLVELLRQPIEAGYGSPAEEELRYSADQIFLEYDEREARE
ncbi:MAG TPA: hypothetical protein VKM72_32870 [Thermoanaerobaculia bacterium]|nr:hypothetical protein [Thermoanaerobaculia bacterium]